MNTAVYREKPSYKYVVVMFHETATKRTYDVVPSTWILSQTEVYFPKYSKCKREQLVQQCSKPEPKKDFKRWTVDILFSTGTKINDHESVCCHIAKL